MEQNWIAARIPTEEVRNILSVRQQWHDPGSLRGGDTTLRSIHSTVEPSANLRENQ